MINFASTCKKFLLLSSFITLVTVTGSAHAADKIEWLQNPQINSIEIGFSNEYSVCRALGFEKAVDGTSVLKSESIPGPISLLFLNAFVNGSGKVSIKLTTSVAPQMVPHQKLASIKCANKVNLPMWTLVGYEMLNPPHLANGTGFSLKSDLNGTCKALGNESSLSSSVNTTYDGQNFSHAIVVNSNGNIVGSESNTLGIGTLVCIKKTNF